MEVNSYDRKPMIDRHILSFRAGPFVGVQRDIKFTIADHVTNEVSYFLSFEGQIKDVTVEFDRLKLDIDKTQQLLAKGKVSALNYHINCLSMKDGFLLVDSDLGVLIQFSIKNGILDVCGEAFTEQDAQLQMDLRSMIVDKQTRVSN
ncbi:MAG: hypothetical protein ACI9TY_000003 [Alphaproteobacteria bacterium]|jgi:hypothetical protein